MSKLEGNSVANFAAVTREKKCNTYVGAPCFRQISDGKLKCANLRMTPPHLQGPGDLIPPARSVFEVFEIDRYLMYLIFFWASIWCIWCIPIGGLGRRGGTTLRPNLGPVEALRVQSAGLPLRTKARARKLYKAQSRVPSKVSPIMSATRGCRVLSVNWLRNFGDFWSDLTWWDLEVSQPLNFVDASLQETMWHVVQLFTSLFDCYGLKYFFHCFYNKKREI